MNFNMDKNIFQIKIKDNDHNPLNEDDFESWNNLFRSWKKAQNSRCHKINKEKYESDADFVKDMDDLTKNKRFHEALITVHQKLVANFIEEIKSYWTGLEKDKDSVIALLCTKYGLDIDQAKSLFECPDQKLGHLWGLNVPMYSLSGVKLDDEQTSRSSKIIYLLTKGEETLFDRLCRLPSPKDIIIKPKEDASGQAAGATAEKPTGEN